MDPRQPLKKWILGKNTFLFFRLCCGLLNIQKQLLLTNTNTVLNCICFLVTCSPDSPNNPSSKKRNKTKSKRKKEKQKNVDDLEMLNNDDSEEEQSFKAEEPHSVVQHELQESSKKLPRTLVPIVSPPLRKLGGFVDDEKKKKSKKKKKKKKKKKSKQSDVVEFFEDE